MASSRSRLPADFTDELNQKLESLGLPETCKGGKVTTNDPLDDGTRWIEFEIYGGAFGVGFHPHEGWKGPRELTDFNTVTAS